MHYFEKNFHYKLIYIFSIDDANHKNLLKIGDATIKTNKFLPPNCAALQNAANARIKKYTNTAGVGYKLLHTELAVKNNSAAFRDYDVHKVLQRSGFQKKKPRGSNAQEWFKVDLPTAKKAITAVKLDKQTIFFDMDDFQPAEFENFLPVIFRPEQEDAIKKTVKTFKKDNKYLWNAKMRFGKTFCALEVVRRMQFPKTIIVTHRPVVNSQWFKDFETIFKAEKNFAYGSKNSGETIKRLLRGNKNFVYFASMQDLRGSEIVNGKFEKNEKIFATDWDLVIVDEAHEGTTTALGDSVIKNLVKANSKLLALSGTPFNILEEYEENIFTWDYLDEQRAKNNWDIEHGTDSNPYAELPEMKIFTYNLGEILNNPAFFDDDKSFNFKEFFRVENEKFVHKNFIKKFLNLLTQDSNNNYPYSNDEFRNIFQHSLWMIPGVKEGRALSKLLKQHWIFKNFEIVNVAGDGDEDEESKDALEKVQEAIKKAEKNNRSTITLSCGKLTTGVTVPEWTAVLMLAGGYSTSAAAYMQTIFRVQSPCRKDGKFKEICYVFDFAPDRSLKFISESIYRTGGNRAKVQEYLNFCPVISLQGSKMIQYNVNNLFQQIKRVQAARVVRNGFDDSNLYNNALLLKLDNNALKKFDKLKGIIGASKAQKKNGDIDINSQGVTGGTETSTDGGKKPVNKELEKAKKLRRTAISILRGISIRMPLLIYGADIDFDQDFTIEMFFDDKIIDAESWKEFMPKGVTKEFFRDFIQYYDQDIFIAAGRKIRDIAKSADNLPPTERVKKIAELFSTFKNPDKETVLTPFRVVNLHLTCALGGFDFFDAEHKNILAEPRFVSLGKTTAATLANPNAHILEINSKTGLYPLLVAYDLYRARLNDSESGYSLSYLQNIWDATLAENVFVICKTPMAKTIIRRTLAGFRHKNINAHYFDDLINTLKNKSAQFVDKIQRQAYWNKGVGYMKFDAVVGNPPYQMILDNNNENYASPIYHEFLKVSFKLQTKVSMIHPARFLFNAGNTPEEFTNKILNDPHFKIVRYEIDSSKFFPNTDIKGGVAISYYDPEENFEPIKMFFPFAELKSIYEKVVGSENFKPLNEIVFGRSQYRLTKKFIEENPDAPKEVLKNQRDFFISNVFTYGEKYFFDEKPNDGKEYIQVWGLIKNKRYCKFIRADYIDVCENKINFYKYKILIPQSNGSGAIGEKLSTPLVGLPLVGNTGTFITLGAFDTRTEADNALKYVKTKFARALLGVLKVTQHNPPATWACVPLQDFSNDSDINWNCSVAEIDAQLYKKYKLAQDEINFIEEKVTAMS